MRRCAGRLVLVGVLALTVTACEWAQPRFDAAHTGNSYETRLGLDNVADLEELWTVDAGDAVMSGPITTSRAVVVQVGPTLRAYEAGTGALRWEVPLPWEHPFGPRSFSDLSSHDGTVHVGYLDPLTSGGAGGGFVTVDARTGESAMRGGGAAPTSAATFTGDDVWYRFASAAPMAGGVFEGVEGRLADGTIVRSIERPDNGGSEGLSPAVSGGVVYASRSGGGFLDAFDAAGVENCTDVGTVVGCNPLWSAPVAGRPAPAVSGSTVYASTGTGVSAYATDVRGPDQQPLWSAEVVGASLVALDPAADASRLFVGSGDGSLQVFDAAGCGASSAPCAPLWRGLTGGAVSSPVVANGLVFVSSADGNVHAFDAAGCGAATCQPVWSAAVPGTPRGPIVADGRVIVTTSTNQVVVFGLP